MINYHRKILRLALNQISQVVKIEQLNFLNNQRVVQFRKLSSVVRFKKITWEIIKTHLIKIRQETV